MNKTAMPLAVALLTLAGAASVQAGPIRLLAESNDDRNAGAEVVQASFANFNDLLNNVQLNQGFTDLNIGSDFSIAGLAYDGAYRLLVESNADRDAGSEVLAATFATYEDLLSFSASSIQFTQINIGANFSLGGFAYDGSYRLLAESNDDRDAGAEVVAGTFATFDDLLTSSALDQSFTQLNIGANFNLTGFSFDGAYQVIAESIDDRVGGAELIGGTFATFNDLLNSNLASQQFSSLDVGANFTTRGLAYEQDPVINVPEPGGLVLTSLALAGLWIRRRHQPLGV